MILWPMYCVIVFSAWRPNQRCKEYRQLQQIDMTFGPISSFVRKWKSGTGFFFGQGNRFGLFPQLFKATGYTPNFKFLKSNFTFEVVPWHWWDSRAFIKYLAVHFK